MFRRLSRLIAVLALALAPVVGAQVTQAHKAAYPVWPSFEADGCNAQPGSGGTWIACGQGGYALTQVNSGYACNELDISVSAYNQGPFLITGTVDSGSQSNSVSVDGTGNYYMRFPGYLVNNLITLQISSPDSGVFAIGSISTSPCPVAPTDTPVPPTDTPNPSDTPTAIPNTVTPGPSQTPTAIPTFTPLPSGHSTFTPTTVPTATGTPAATSTPSGTPYFDCGSPDFPLLNCSMLGSSATGVAQPDSVSYSNAWVAVVRSGYDTYWQANCSNWGPCASFTGAHPHSVFSQGNGTGPPTSTGYQDVTARASGTLHVDMNEETSSFGGAANTQVCLTNGSAVSPSDASAVCTTVVTSGPQDFSLTTVSNGTAYRFWIGSVSAVWELISVYVVTTGPTSTPAVPGASPTLAAATATEAARETATALAASSTPTTIPIPGAQSTPVATDTECPGGCAVAKLTSVTGIATRVGVDTSPFSALTHLSLARSSCQPFGYVQIPVPVIVGTPVLGSTTPLSVTWTVPVTHAWDDTHLITNTAIQPCAMTNEIPSFLWDLTYWGSVLGIAVVFTLWLIGFVGRISGDHTING